MIHHDFRMHGSGVLLFLLLLACRAVALRRRMLVIVSWAIVVNRPYLCADAYGECEYAN